MKSVVLIFGSSWLLLLNSLVADDILLGVSETIELSATIPTVTNSITGFEFHYGVSDASDYGAKLEGVFSFGNLRATLEDIGKTFVVTREDDPSFDRVVSILTNGVIDTHIFRVYALSDGYTATNWSPKDVDKGAVSELETTTHILYNQFAGHGIDLFGFVLNEIHLEIISGNISSEEGATATELEIKIRLYGVHGVLGEDFQVLPPDLSTSIDQDRNPILIFQTQYGVSYAVLVSFDMKEWQELPSFSGDGKEYYTPFVGGPGNALFFRVKYNDEVVPF